MTTNSCKFLLKGHGNSIFGLKQINSEILASGSYDATIKLWNITNGQLIRTLEGHTDQIWWSLDVLVYDNGEGEHSLLVSGSRDQIINVWNWTTGEVVSKIYTNSYIVALVVIDDFSNIDV